MRHRNGKLYLDFGAVKQVTKAAVELDLQLEFIQWDSHLLSKWLGRSLSIHRLVCLGGDCCDVADR